MKDVIALKIWGMHGGNLDIRNGVPALLPNVATLIDKCVINDGTTDHLCKVISSEV